LTLKLRYRDELGELRRHERLESLEKPPE